MAGIKGLTCFTILNTYCGLEQVKRDRILEEQAYVFLKGDNMPLEPSSNN